MQSLEELKERIQVLEAEKSQLTMEVEALRIAAQEKVTALESQISRMQQEAKVLREL